MTELEIYLTTWEPAQAPLLRDELGDCPGVHVLDVRMAEAASAASLDADFLSPTFAEELGSRPLGHRATVLQVPPGAPESNAPFVITGFSMSVDEPHEVEDFLPIALHAILEAVERHNESDEHKIRRVGIWLPFLGVKDPPAFPVAARMIRDFVQSQAD